MSDFDEYRTITGRKQVVKTIAVVGMSSNPGGVETYLLNFIEAVQSTYEITLINQELSNPVAYENQLKMKGIHFFDARGKFAVHTFLGRAETAKKILTAIKADAVYVNALTPNQAFWVSAARQLGIPAIYHSHNANEVSSSKIKHVLSVLLRSHNQRVLKYATRLSASQAAGEFMFGTKASFNVVHNAIHPEEWQYDQAKRAEIREKFHISMNAKVIVSVARIDTQKNPLRLIHIVARVVKQDADYMCVMVGDGVLRKECELEIHKLGLDESIKIVGRQSNVPEWLSASDIFLLPSLFEGLPFVVVEAQGSGLPIIASTGVVPEIADITKQLHEVPLNDSDNKWKDIICSTRLNNSGQRLRANMQVADSLFAFHNYVDEIKSIFAESLGK